MRVRESTRRDPRWRGRTDSDGPASDHLSMSIVWAPMNGGPGAKALGVKETISVWRSLEVGDV